MTPSAFASPDSANEIIHLPMVQHLVQGQEYHARGRIEEAISSYRSGLAAAGDDASNHLAMATKAELHAKHGNAYLVSIRLAVPGSALAVNGGSAEGGDQDLYATIRDAFDVAERQLEDWNGKRQEFNRSRAGNLASLG